MITIIKDHNIVDVKNSIKYLLDEASKSEKVRELAVEIVSSNPDHIAAIHSWVKANVQYVLDPVADGEIELLTSPVRMANNYFEGKPLVGDCDCMSLLTTSLYRAVGIKSNFVMIDTKGKGFDHAVTQAYSYKLEEWVTVDTASEYPLGWEVTCYEKIII